MYDWSRDGRFAAYCEMNPQTKIDVWILPMGVDAKPYPLLHTAFNEDSPQFSPNVRWMAYVSDETGRNEVYVAGFPDATAKWQISTQGGSIPRWRSDGKGAFLPGGRRPSDVLTNHIQAGRSCNGRRRTGCF